MTRVKICGITRPEDAERACASGADALGFVFYPRSPRAVDPEQVRQIVDGLPPFVVSVGVFVDSPLREVLDIADRCRLNAVQLHGREDPDYCSRIPLKVIKAFRIAGDRLPEEISRYRVDAILLDTHRPGVPGGTGETFCWDVAREAKKFGRIILAGGLDCTNVAEAIAQVQPYAVDVSSGVEREPGLKDPVLLAEFLRRAKGACRRKDCP